MPTQHSPFIDIFCRVIDNYGDIGVCWRFAKDLHHILHTYTTQKEHNKYTNKSLLHTLFHPDTHQAHPIRLWVDDLQSFAKIEPALKHYIDALPRDSNSSPICTYIKGIEIRHWQAAAMNAWLHDHQAPLIPAPIVIEAFGTDLDDAFIQAMRGHTHYWFNLEYLSAEDWVEGFHGQASPQANGVPKYFFFPGFTDKTGGLIREEGLITRLDAFSSSAKTAWLAHHISPHVAQAYQEGARFIHLFCYPSAPFASLVEALCDIYAIDKRPTVLLLAHGVLPNAEDLCYAYRQQSHADIRLVRFAFMPQEQFDYLLQVADINIIRGEDSFVRAIWSGKPFIWHIYEQQEDTHFDKLNAWLNSSPRVHPLTQLQQDWNRYAAWNNPAIKPAPIEQATQEKQKLHQHLKAQWMTLLNPTNEAQWQQLCTFHLNYRENLRKNPTLSFSLLNFQAKQI